MNQLEIHKFLDKIINSKAFSHSDVYGKLLKYLTEATLNGEKPKEYTIGADIFNQKADSPSTSKVRVSVHNLRKKLDVYYKEEGCSDSILLSIPKGTYTLEFKQKKEQFLKKNSRSILIIGLGIVLITLLTSLTLFLTSSDNLKLKRTKFWNEILCNKKETIIVIGDFFIFQEETTQIKNDTSPENNSSPNSLALLSKNNSDEGVIFPKNDSYIPYAAILSLPYIIPMLDRNKVNYKIILSSNFRWETFNNYNIIYIGSFNHLNALSYLTENKLHIKHNSSNNTLILADNGEERLYASTINNSVTSDYTLVAKLPGPSENIFYIFGSNHEIGCIESIKYFTQIDSVNNFGKVKLKDANYFKGIFKAEGVEHINMMFNLVEYKTITDTALTHFWHY